MEFYSEGDQCLRWAVETEVKTELNPIFCCLAVFVSMMQLYAWDIVNVYIQPVTVDLLSTSQCLYTINLICFLITFLEVQNSRSKTFYKMVLENNYHFCIQFKVYLEKFGYV